MSDSLMVATTVPFSFGGIPYRADLCLRVGEHISVDLPNWRRHLAEIVAVGRTDVTVLLPASPADAITPAK